MGANQGLSQVNDKAAWAWGVITSAQNAKDLLNGWKDGSTPVLVSLTTERSNLRFNGATAVRRNLNRRMEALRPA